MSTMLSKLSVLYAIEGIADKINTAVHNNDLDMVSEAFGNIMNLNQHIPDPLALLLTRGFLSASEHIKESIEYENTKHIHASKIHNYRLFLKRRESSVRNKIGGAL